MRFNFKPLAAATLMMAAAGSAHATTEITWWYSNTGALSDRIQNMVADFNKSQSDYKVKAIYKGGYDESMSAAIAAYRAGNAPNILQVFEVGTATMMHAKGAIVSVTKLMKDAGEKFDPKAYVPAVASYYTTNKGEMLSLPFNSSTTVFFYNKDLFAKAGLDPEKPPVTWKDVEADAKKLKAAGVECPFTTSWQSWVQLESFSAWHNVAFASKDNGMGGLDARLEFNSPLHVRHIQNLANWAKQGLFVYSGRKTEGDSKFYTGKCAMLTSSSATYGNVVKNAQFKFGVSPLPYYADVKGAPQNTVIGGASLWVMSGKKPDEYKGVAKFFAYLSKPEVQAAWHQGTGYLPATIAAYELTKESGFYKTHPGTDVAVKQMIVKTTDKSRGIRLGNFVQIRGIIDEELEGVWAGKKTPKQALDSAVERGNKLLVRFQKANQ
ncbi:sn-glycerol-3-phosphate ABC transporter substrate-binding protein UgpB [Candidimonas nitroreducens]|uniref:sn-glycerol-3-phosphate-binding periplasmic protein UgpB n=1 Tax=Candidimonas nitroreducens TaxID=683354 RepID=A0A225MYZ4_9BURK|nr:sn-glycerol-3-phosphate ABC transporter substrate-binding protein UgpB [Candidimonas nitroreducens]OWT66334.1 sn-glycerol-3-phosphate ABC transporter substrate-binding protein [Candidimonas nitroreducens]